MSEKKPSKDIENTLTTTQYLGSNALEKGGRAIEEGSKKLSKLYDELKEELLTPETTAIARVATLDYDAMEESSQKNGVTSSLILTNKRIKPVNVSGKCSFNSPEDLHAPIHQGQQLKSPYTKDPLLISYQSNTKSGFEDKTSSDNWKIKFNKDGKIIINDNVDLLRNNGATKNKDCLLRIKTLVYKASEASQKIDVLKLTENAGKVASKAGTVGKKATKLSRRIQTSINDDGTGRKFFSDEIKRTAMKIVVKKTSKAVTKRLTKWSNKGILYKVKTIMKATIKSMLKKALLFLAGMLISYLPIAIIMAVLASTLSIFGGGDESIVKQYETLMGEIQEEYDQSVDDWMEKNPKGTVVGIRGDYGDIDWKVPLSIIQGLDSGLNLDFYELKLIREFQNAGLLEQHTEIIDTIEVIDSDDEKHEIEVKYLAISNPGYDDYMKWLESNYDIINDFKIGKNLPESTSFSDIDRESINTLYTSDTFFDLFSKEFQDHETSTGSNLAETDYDSPEYNRLNPFTANGYKGQCTWYVFGRVLKVTGKRMPTGNAVLWLQNAKAMGYATGSHPGQNAIVVLAGNNFGHVSFVEAWDGTNITISEGNYNNPCASGQCSAVEYARKHYDELIHQATYESFEAYKKAAKEQGLTVIGFIYTD